MNSQTQTQNSITKTSKDDHDHHDQDQDLDHAVDLDHDYDLDLDLDHEDGDHNNGEDILNTEPDPLHYVDNNPPDSFCVSQTKVTDWLDRHTFIERKTSVKFAITRNSDPTQNRCSNRSVSLNNKAKLSIIGFRKKPVKQTDGKPKQNDGAENIRLFRNRSEPGKDYCLLITEPLSPRVSCIGRVGSMRVQGRKTGVWTSVKAALSNLVQPGRPAKVVR